MHRNAEFDRWSLTFYSLQFLFLLFLPRCLYVTRQREINTSTRRRPLTCVCIYLRWKSHRNDSLAAHNAPAANEIRIFSLRQEGKVMLLPSTDMGVLRENRGVSSWRLLLGGFSIISLVRCSREKSVVLLYASRLISFFHTLSTSNLVQKITGLFIFWANSLSLRIISNERVNI